MKKQELTILGGYGALNFGDDIMLFTLVREVKRELPNLKINIFGVSNKIELHSFENVEIFVFARNSKIKNILSFFKVMLRTKMLIIAGGTVFTDEDSVGAFNHFLLAYLMRVKLGYVGIGIGNLKKKSRIIKTKILLALSTFITFRDELSFEFAKNNSSQINKFTLTEDLAYLYYNKSISNRYNNQFKVLLINWRGLTRYFHKGFLEILEINFCLAIERFIKYNDFKEIRILPLDSNVDKEISLKILNILKEKLPQISIRLINETSFEKKINEIANSSFFLSFRLHGLFFAKLHAIPSIGFNYSPKVNSFLQTIKCDNVIFPSDINVELVYDKMNKSFLDINILSQDDILLEFRKRSLRNILILIEEIRK